jgi:hypothetical protein
LATPKLLDFNHNQLLDSLSAETFTQVAHTRLGGELAQLFIEFV